MPGGPSYKPIIPHCLLLFTQLPVILSFYAFCRRSDVRKMASFTSIFGFFYIGPLQAQSKQDANYIRDMVSTLFIPCLYPVYNVFTTKVFPPSLQEKISCLTFENMVEMVNAEARY